MDGDLRAGAIAWARELAAARAPLRRVSELPVPPSRPAQFEEYLRILPQAARRLPAPPRIVEALAATAMLPVDAALARARALFLECLASTESRALRHLFFAERAASAAIRNSRAPSATRPCSAQARWARGSRSALRPAASR